MTRTPTTTERNRKSRRPLTPWELPTLLTPMYQQRKSTQPKAKDRPHFPAILAFVHRNRFAVASQIQRRFSTIMKSDRTARRHLSEMQALGYLDVAPTRSTSPLWPKVYYVTQQGAKRLRQALAAKGKPGSVIRVDRKRSEGYSADHVVHELLTTEFLLALWQTGNSSDGIEILRTERRSLERHPAFRIARNARVSELTPDAMFMHREQSRGMMCSFVELDTGSMSMSQIESKYRRYEMWASSTNGREFLTNLYQQHGASNPRPIFRVLFVVGEHGCANPVHRIADLLSAVWPLATLRDRLWLTTTTEMRRHQESETPLRQVDWWTGPATVDAVAAGCEEHVSSQELRDLLRLHISELPVRTLFK